MMTSRKILCLALILTMVVAMFGGCAAKPAVAAEHQDLRGVLVHDRERIALAVA